MTELFQTTKQNISVGYRVNSMRNTQFRIRATQQLSELMRKGFVLDWERLKNPQIKGTTVLPDNFDELPDQTRDIFALSADYTPNKKVTDAREQAQKQYRLFCERRRDTAVSTLVSSKLGNIRK